MKRFLMTSTHFTGEAEIVYDETGLLFRLDVGNTNMDLTQRNYIFRRLPILEAGDEENASLSTFAQALKGTTIVQADIEVTVEDFYKVYPYKRNRYTLDKEWNKLTKAEKVRAYFSAQEYAAYLKRNPWQNPKIVGAWIKEKQFLNDWKTL